MFHAEGIVEIRLRTDEDLHALRRALSSETTVQQLAEALEMDAVSLAKGALIFTDLDRVAPHARCRRSWQVGPPSL